MILTFSKPCSSKEGNNPLKNLIPLGCLCKQKPPTVFSINKVFPLAKMSMQNFSGKTYGLYFEAMLKQRF